MSGLEIIGSVIAVAGAALQLANLTSDFGFQLSTAAKETEAFASRLRLFSDAAKDLGQTFEKALETLEPDDLSRSTVRQLILSPHRTIDDTQTFLTHVLGTKTGKPVPGNAACSLIKPERPLPRIRMSPMLRLRWIWGRKHLSRLKDEIRDLQGEMVVLGLTMQLKISLYVSPIRSVQRRNSWPVRRSEQRNIQLLQDLSTRLGPRS